MKGRVLIIAGSDSGGGAGIQADIKTVTMLGGYAMTAITAVTVQDTQRVHAVHALPAEVVCAQIRVVIQDIGVDAIKIGMLGDAALITAVSESIQRHAPGVPLVVDPVMVAKSGDALLTDKPAVDALKRSLMLHATLLTPNIPEAEILSGAKIPRHAAMAEVAAMLRTIGPQNVLLKGGHLPGDVVHDVLSSEEGLEVFESPRVNSPHTHGTGCTLASAIALGMAQDMPLALAVARARDYVAAAIRTAPGYGKGHGPMNHGHGLPDQKS